MDDHFDHEITMEARRRTFQVIYKDREQSVSLPVCIHIYPGPCADRPTVMPGLGPPKLQMKCTVSAFLTDVLLLQVTIVPLAVGGGVGAVGTLSTRTGVGAAIGTGVGAESCCGITR